MRHPKRILLSVIVLLSGAVTAADNPPKVPQPAQTPVILAAVEVVVASDGALDESAQRSLLASRWRPFVVNGAPISCEMLLPIVFLPNVDPPVTVDSKPFRDALTDPCPELSLATKIENTIL